MNPDRRTISKTSYSEARDFAGNAADPSRLGGNALLCSRGPAVSGRRHECALMLDGLFALLSNSGTSKGGHLAEDFYPRFHD